MNSLQVIHYWVSASALVMLLVALLSTITGLTFPLRSKLGDRLVTWGVAGLVGTVAVYLVYAATAITTVVVMRS